MRDTMAAVTLMGMTILGCGDDATTSPDAALAVDADADAGPDASEAVPMIQDFLAAQCGAYTPPGGVSAGDDLHRVVLDNPDAICSDGTRAAMYIRPSTGGANANRWVFYFQGGGFCGQFEECAIRYCGTGQYTKTKMSMQWSPEVASTDGQGLLDRDGTNPSGDVNTVLVYYCSSDQWLGRRSNVVLENPDDATQKYRIHFRGHTIVESVFDQLLAGPVTSDDTAVTLPDLSDATFALIAGSSAGGTGVEHNIDYVASRLQSNGTQVRAVIDGAFPPRYSDFGAQNEQALDMLDRNALWPVVYQGNFDAYVDASCLAMHAAEPWRCVNKAHVVMNHVTTPFFVRQDHRDRTQGGRFLDLGATIEELGAATHAALVDLSEIRQDGEEGPAMTVTPGVYGPNCGQHIALTNEDWFRTATVENEDGAALTLRGALGLWLTGTAVDAVDTDPRSTSTCPPPVDNGE